jgi:hypothetical protein
MSKVGNVSAEFGNGSGESTDKTQSSVGPCAIEVYSTYHLVSKFI